MDVQKIPSVGWATNSRKTSHEVRTIYELLDVIRIKPEVFIGDRSLTALQHFIAGFSAALYAVENAFEKETPPLGDFHAWIARRLGFPNTGKGWSGMLLESAGDEMSAYERFFLELDEFRRASH